MHMRVRVRVSVCPSPSQKPQQPTHPTQHTQTHTKSNQPTNRYAPVFIWALEFAWLKALKACPAPWVAYGLTALLVFELLWARILLRQVRVYVCCVCSRVVSRVVHPPFPCCLASSTLPLHTHLSNSR